MSVALVVAESEAVGMREAGDSAFVLETIGPVEGSETLVQRVIRFAPGRSRTRSDEAHDELLYVVSGSGTIALGGQLHELAAGTACHVTAGDVYTVDNGSDDDLVVLSVLVPPTDRQGEPVQAREAVVRREDRPEQRADAKRTF